VDGDGDRDILAASRLDDSVTCFENDGNQNFTAHVISSEVDGIMSVTVVDMDGNGNLDVLVASAIGDSISWFNQQSIPSAIAEGNDTDSDSAADSWEWSHFGTLSLDADADPDGDGTGNMAEYIAGTDPNDGQSTFQVSISRTDGDAQVRFMGHAANGSAYAGFDRYYSLERTTDLIHGRWEPVPGCTAVLGQNLMIEHVAARKGLVLFRARVELRTK
jgi:hypothetical protein